MNIASKLNILAQVYKIYDEFAATRELACQKSCSHCCTVDITLTTLEGYQIIDSLKQTQRSDLIGKLVSQSKIKRFQPRLTTNQLADICAKGLEPPDDNTHVTGEMCSLLTQSLCPIYGLRPFSCRCLVSRYNCGERGYAEIDDFTLSVNTVFIQTIEHVDSTGCTGNMIDVMGVLWFSENRKAYENNFLECTKAGLICNHPLKALMIPPQHRTKMEPILQSLRKIRI
jgi:hypothetical protein